MKIILRQKIVEFCYSNKAYFMLLPVIGLFLVFSFGPILYAAGLSLIKWDLIIKPTFVGLANYTDIFINDPKFIASLLNNLFFAGMMIGVGIPLALVVALLLNKVTFSFARSVYLLFYFLPVITSMVVVALVWKFLYNPGIGLINELLWTLHLFPQRWLSSSQQALPSIAVTAIWKDVGFNTVLFLAALQGIPLTFYEAAKIDGASRWHNFRYITLPLLAPVTFFVLVITVINCFKVFTLVFMMTSKGQQAGGPGTSTLVMGLYTYQSAFRNNEYGYGTALAFITLFIILIFTFLQFRIYRKKIAWEY